MVHLGGLALKHQPMILASENTNRDIYCVIVQRIALCVENPLFMAGWNNQGSKKVRKQESKRGKKKRKDCIP